MSEDTIQPIVPEYEGLGPATGYVDLLDAVTTANLQKQEDEGKGFQKTPLRPSASGACSRELFFQLQEFHGLAKYPKEVITPETSRLFSLGHSVEWNIIRQFEQLKDVFDIRYKQQVLSFEYLKANKHPEMSQWLEGSLDMVFWSEKWKCVADVKSKKDKFHAYYKTDWDSTSAKLASMASVKPIGDSQCAFWVENLEDFLEELNNPFFEANFVQLNMYANSTFLKERGVDHGAIIQYSKNDSRLREIRFKPSEALYKKTVAKFQNVLTAVDENRPELAPRDYALGSIKCAFCSYKTECWDKDDALKAYFKTFPPKEWPRDTDRLGEGGQQLDSLIDAFEDATQGAEEAKRLEQQIVKIAVDLGVNKLRFHNGNIYEVKRLKDSVVLRRSKL